MDKQHTISCNGRLVSGTLDYLIGYHKYSLEKGASYAHEKGNKKINTQPKTIKSLVSNLNHADNNSAANGQGNKFYQHEE